MPLASLRHLDHNRYLNRLAVVGQGFVAIGIESDGNFVAAWGDLDELTTGGNGLPMQIGVFAPTRNEEIRG
ncbi:MAG: hypothetical protein EA342_19890 [Leptolyngbya sp. LCM1.Bin17]|nr:MAG: hypothetical protein EA342_19890 [Leptolyngbya sp. LCM1.Bin17]